jgi:uncharacterized membrane protein YkvA (DUF1232 family)
MNNFFMSALRNAALVAGKPSRLLVILSKLASKVKNTNWRNVNAAAGKEKLYVLGRFVRAYAMGEYREVPWRTILWIVAAILYFINPLDLIPDLIPVTGLTDDFAVLLWVYNSVSNEIEKFLIWEQSRLGQS